MYSETQAELRHYDTIHYILRAWKSFNVASWVQTPIFKTKIAKGIQKWVQTNQFQVPPVSNFFKLLFSLPKIMKKIGRFVDFWNFISIYVHK